VTNAAPRVGLFNGQGGLIFEKAGRCDGQILKY